MDDLCSTHIYTYNIYNQIPNVRALQQFDVQNAAAHKYTAAKHVVHLVKVCSRFACVPLIPI